MTEEIRESETETNTQEFVLDEIDVAEALQMTSEKLTCGTYNL